MWNFRATHWNPTQKYLTPPLKDVNFIERRTFKSSWIQELVCVFLNGPGITIAILLPLEPRTLYQNPCGSVCNGIGILAVPKTNKITGFPPKPITVRCRYNAANFFSRGGEIWGACFYSNIWFSFCHCYHSVVYNIVMNQTALWRHLTVLHITRLFLLMNNLHIRLAVTIYQII